MPDETAQGAPDLARVTELIKSADRLGLTWGLRPGTVQLTTSPYSPREASVRMDGDDGTITVVSLMGDLFVGDRVMVMRVPPAGEYAIGALNRAPSTIYTQAATTNTALIIAETVTFTLPSVHLQLGTAYRVEGGNRIDAAGASSATFRLRKTNIAGAVVAISPTFFGVGLGISASAHWTSFITPASTMTTDFVYTMQATVAGSVSVGTATAPRFVSITPSGPSSLFPQAVSVS